MKYFIFLILILTSFFSSCEENQFKLSEPTALECEYLTDPLGIDVVTPRLSWKLSPDGSFIKQQSYHILAADNLKDLENNIGNLWDTKKVHSDQSIQLKYKGNKLVSRQKVFWKVRVWNQDDEISGWSKIATWEMALLQSSEWKANWIGTGELKNPKRKLKNPTSYFRKEFIVEKGIQNARIYISSIGYFELFINGKKIGDHVLSPNQTNYDKRQETGFEDKRVANMSSRNLYETFDISKYLQNGKNVIAVILGNGWSYRPERVEYLPLNYGLPHFIAQLEIDFPKSEKQQILSDATWKYNKGPIVENSIYHGEVYDARLEQPGWNKKGFDDKKWSEVQVVRSPKGKLHAQMSPPDRVTSTIKPVSIKTLKKGVYVYDFGTVFSGWAKLKISGKKGSKIKMTFLEDNGNNFEQRDTYILKGEGTEIWEPKFTWHAFRYVEVSSPDISLTIENLEGKLVHTDVNSAGTFNSSNELFNRILNDFKNTQLDNMHGGIPSDCPHRERRGYTGDGQIAAQAAIYSLDMKSFYTKWLHDIADAQNSKTGYVPNTVPFQNGAGGTPWGSAYIIIPWYMYLYYGDTTILKEHYEGMKHYLDYLKTQTDSEGLIVENNLGEWVPPVSTEIPPSFVSSAFYFYDLTLMHHIATILNKDNDAKTFLKTKKRVKDSFNTRYYKPKKSCYSIGWQGANVFPLAFDLVPKKYEAEVFQSLVYNVEVKAKGHFDTGVMATPYLLEVLTKYGRTDLAYTVMNRRDFPSFGYNIERGATSLWEDWVGNDSHSHPMFGSVTSWFFKSLGGINPDPKSPGFKHIIIKPNIVSEIDFANTTYPSRYGKIKSDWKINNDTFKLHVTIPPNTSASVFIPTSTVDHVSTDHSKVKFIGFENNFAHYEVPSGEYDFTSKNIGKIIKTPMLSIPVIHPADATFFSPNSVKVNIQQYSKDAKIHYTLDGSEPNEDSELFTQPFTINNSVIVKAKTFKKGTDPSFTKMNKITFIDSLHNGLRYNYYAGTWVKLPEFSKLKPVRSGRVFNISLNEFDEFDNAFAIVFFGEINIHKKDLYTFYLRSNDGSRLSIDDKLVIDFDGLHGASLKSGKVKLKKGRHLIKLEYFQAGGGKGLELYYDSPEIEKQLIPADIFFLNSISKH